MAKGDGSSSEGSATQQQGMHTASTGRTGPRTQAGKDRSKRNAIKHGLFSHVIVLSHESQSEFDDLVSGLRRDLKPEGLLEETLVEKIATILWRYRRFLQAESADVQRNMENQEILDDEDENENNEPATGSLDMEAGLEQDRPRSLEVFKLAIPDAYSQDRFLRCEASLDRAFDRALMQLQRLQHLRKSHETIEVASHDVQVATQLIGRS